jgi:hypothetical protein
VGLGLDGDRGALEVNHALALGPRERRVEDSVIVERPWHDGRVV